jgi:hypothetical protein
MLRYYLRGEEYIRRGPPHVLLRAVVAPIVVLSTLVLFGTGVALLVLHERHGTLVGLHKASFVVWLVATGLHVLVHTPRLLRALSRRIPGARSRLALVSLAAVAGVALATVTLPAADRLQDRASGVMGVDAR